MTRRSFFGTLTAALGALAFWRKKPEIPSALYFQLMDEAQHPEDYLGVDQYEQIWRESEELYLKRPSANYVLEGIEEA